MPELPEVETVRRQLEISILHKRIVSIEIRNKTSLRQSVALFTKKISGGNFESIDRIGKLLELKLNNGSILLVHLKMTGQLLYLENKQKLNIDKHTHVLINFSDSSILAFRDIRKFGYLSVVSAEELRKTEDNYGIDPLRKNFTREAFLQAFQKKKKSLKALLLDQKLIAGIGNIYADEICHISGLVPDSLVPGLSEKQLNTLFDSCLEIINKAVRYKGTTFRDYVSPDGMKGNFAYELKVYGREGKNCLSCKNGIITKITHAGRGTHFCGVCQK